MVKLMFLIMLAALGVAMLRPLLFKSRPAVEPLQIDVTHLEVGGMQGVEWNRKRLLILHPSVGENYLVIADYDPIYGCPLLWVGADNAEAPLQPWPGGLKAVCTPHWFDVTGKALGEGVPSLQRLPYFIKSPNTLVISAPSN